MDRPHLRKSGEVFIYRLRLEEFQRIHRHPVFPHGEVQVGSRERPALSHGPDDLSCLERVSRCATRCEERCPYISSVPSAVSRITVLPITAQLSGEADDAPGCGDHRLARSRRGCRSPSWSRRVFSIGGSGNRSRRKCGPVPAPAIERGGGGGDGTDFPFHPNTLRRSGESPRTRKRDCHVTGPFPVLLSSVIPQVRAAAWAASSTSQGSAFPSPSPSTKPRLPRSRAGLKGPIAPSLRDHVFPSADPRAGALPKLVSRCGWRRGRSTGSPYFAPRFLIDVQEVGGNLF